MDIHIKMEEPALNRYFNEVDLFNGLVEYLKEKIKNDNDAAIEFITNNNLHSLVDSNGSDLLHHSISHRYSSMTRWLLAQGFDVNVQSKNDDTPLMMAVICDNERIVNILLKANADVCIAKKSGETVFDMLDYDMIMTSRIPKMIMMKLIEKCQNEEDSVMKLWSINCPIYKAALLRDTKIIKFLLERGIDPDTCDPIRKITALHVAAYRHDWKNVKLLLDYGADVNAQDIDGKTPIAFISSHQYEEDNKLRILRILLNRGAKLNTFTKFGVMQIYKILNYCSKEAIQLVLRKNLDLKERDVHGDTPLHYLAGNSHPGVFELLENQSINLNARNQRGWTSLHLAAATGHSNMVQYLLSRGANANAQNVFGMTPLMYALIRQEQGKADIECVELLLQYGANAQLMTYYFWTVLDVVAKSENFILIKPVLAHLAMLHSCGAPILKKIYMQICGYMRFQKLYAKYWKQIQSYKKIIIDDSLTMFHMLIMSDHKLFLYLRNRQLALKLERMQYKQSNYTYYRRLLRRRVKRVYRKMYLIPRAAVTLCTIMNICPGSHAVVTEKICMLLTEYDLIQLANV